MGNHHSQHTSNVHCVEDPIPTTVGAHYKVSKELGKGSFGVLYEGVNLLDDTLVAVKFESKHTDTPQLKDEYVAYLELAGAYGIPKAYYYGQEGGYNILVVDLLGPTLQDLFDMCEKSLSPKTVAMLAKKMLRLLETVHEHGLIYRDVKPENFLIGRPGTQDHNQFFLIDFGLAKRYIDPRTQKHIVFRERCSLSGTARYMSVNTHLGKEQSRRDDLEALGYVLLYLLRGSLPWQGLHAGTEQEKYEKIGDIKCATSIQGLCAGLPMEFSIFMHYVRNLRFDEKPDYVFCCELFDKALKRIGATDDGVYDWDLINHGHGWEASYVSSNQTQEPPGQ